MRYRTHSKFMNALEGQSNFFLEEFGFNLLNHRRNKFDFDPEIREDVLEAADDTPKDLLELIWQKTLKDLRDSPPPRAQDSDEDDFEEDEDVDYDE